jgi:hypothetical protein
VKPGLTHGLPPKPLLKHLVGVVLVSALQAVRRCG